MSFAPLPAWTWLPLVAALGCARPGSEPDSPGQSRSGCELDLDCAAERVCEDRRCVRWWKLSGDPPEVTPRQLDAMLSGPEPPQILDVRTRAEFEAGHIPGAVSVPLGQLESHLDALPVDRSQPVVAICLTAHRSIGAVRLLSRRGYRIVQLQGGMIRWRHERLPTTKD